MKRFSLLLFVIFISISSFSQKSDFYNKHSSSIKALLNGKIIPRNELFNIYNQYNNNDIDSLKYYAGQMINIGLAESNWLFINFGKAFLASYYNTVRNPDLSIPMARKSMDYFIKKSDYSMISFIQNQLGIGNIISKNYIEAKEWLIKSMESAALSSNYIENSIAIKNLAECTYLEGKYHEALSYIEKFIATIKDSKNYVSLGEAYITTGKIYLAMSNKEKALEFFQKADEISNEGKVSNALKGDIYNNLAIIYYDDKPQQSKEYFLKALNVRKIAQKVEAISDSYLNIGNWYWGNNQNDSAKYYFNQMLTFNEKNNYRQGIVEAYETLSNYYEEQGNYKEAFAYLSKYKEEREREDREKRRTIEADFVFTNNLNNQEQELAYKSETNEIRNTFERQLRKNKNTIIITIIAIICLLGFYTYNSRKVKNLSQPEK